eukprot:4189908-Prymnesium_polylepis.1
MLGSGEAARQACSLRLLPMGLPDLLQEGHRRNPASGAQADRPARCGSQEAAQEAGEVTAKQCRVVDQGL